LRLEGREGGAGEEVRVTLGVISDKGRAEIKADGATLTLDLLGRLDEHAELVPLVFEGHSVADYGGGEAALGADGEPL
jgi:hypothetical protein